MPLTAPRTLLTRPCEYRLEARGETCRAVERRRPDLNVEHAEERKLEYMIHLGSEDATATIPDRQ